MSDTSQDHNTPLHEVARLIRESGVPALHIQRSVTQKNARWVSAYNLSLSIMRANRSAIVALIGPRGTGKTQIAAELIRHCALRGLDPMYCRTYEMFMRIKAAYGPSANYSESDAIRCFIRPALLVLDEVQVRYDTDWERSTLTHIIDCRYGEMRRTLLIANLPPEEFAATMGPSIMDRLDETGQVIECDWESFRKAACAVHNSDEGGVK